MNITIVSLALMTSLSSLPNVNSGVTATQTSMLSKDEIMKIITTEQKSTPNLKGFVINLPALTLENGTSTASVRRISSASSETQTTASGE